MIKSKASQFDRRTFLAGTAALLPGTVAFAQGADKTPVVRTGLFSGVGLPGIFAGITQGYFAAEKVTPDLQYFGSGPAMISAMLGGSLDVTHADVLSWAAAIGAGREIMLATPASLAPTPEGDPRATWRIITAKSSGLTKPEQLVGKKIGVGTSQLSMVTVKAWLVKNGIDPSKVTLEVVAQPSGMANMLTSGTVHAAMAGDPAVAQLNQQIGVEVLGWPYETVPTGATFSGLFATKAYCTTHRDALTRYVRAFRRGAAYFNKASAAERASMMKLANLDIVALDQKLPGLLQAFRYNRAADLPVDADATQRWVDMGVQYGGVPKTVDIRPFINETARDIGN